MTEWASGSGPMHANPEYIEGLPFKAYVAYAYSPRENEGSRGTTHCVVNEDVTIGRIHRAPGQALCTTREFWGLDYRPPSRGVHCKACQAIMGRIMAYKDAQP